jgi:hypothetical protein
MKKLFRDTSLLIIATLTVILQIYINQSCCFAESNKAPLSPEESRRLGEKIYREGILPSGEPMQALVREDLPTPGTLFSCVSCHLRSGLGSFEGGVFTPPTTGNKLFQPYQTLYKGTVQNPKYFPIPPRRPAYTEKTLIDAIQNGVDPNGKKLNDVMPRYLLEDKDMAILISYLTSLSKVYSPGVTDTNLHFATVISEDVSPEDRNAMLTPLQNYFNLKNSQVKFFKTPGSARSQLMAQNMAASKEFTNLTLTLSPWILKGPPDTWKTQLEEYNRKDPAFALIGGITTGTWEPIHRFSEANQIPCLFPSTDYPVISSTDWYTLYLSKGYYQEGEASARYLHSQEPSISDKKIVQIVRDSGEGLALSAGFKETWHDLGHEYPLTVSLKPGDELSSADKDLIARNGKPGVILVWDGPQALKILETLEPSDIKPDMAFVSSSYLGNNIWALKDQLRKVTYITYPYRLPQQPDKTSNSHSVKKKFTVDTSKVANQTYSIIEILNMALMDMRGNYYRDNFLDVIGMIMDQEVPLYERLSFGPGQRYASKGCYIVQLGNGPKPQLVQKSDWVVH